MGKTGPVTDLQRDFLGTVQEQTGHLQRLIEDLLEFSRLESGQVRLRPVRVSPAGAGRHRGGQAVAPGRQTVSGAGDGAAGGLARRSRPTPCVWSRC